MSKQYTAEELRDIIDNDSAFTVFDYPGIEPPSVSIEEKQENQAAIKRFGKEFTYLHRDVLPACDKLSFPLNDAEIGWIGDHVRDYGWEIFDKHFILSKEIEQKIKTLSSQKLKGKALYDALNDINTYVQKNDMENS